MIISICIYISPYIWMYILRIVLIFRIFSLFHGLFGFVGWEEVEFYIPPQPRDDDVEWALGCD